MKKIFLTLIAFLGLSSFVYATEMPSISINSAFLYSFETGEITAAPSVGITLLTAYDGILKGNFEAVFTDKDTAGQAFIGGPMLKVDGVKLLGKAPQITIIREFKLEAGLGVMIDLFHLEGLSLSDVKKILYPSLSIGFSF